MYVALRLWECDSETVDSGETELEHNFNKFSQMFRRTPSWPQEAGGFSARVADRVQDIYHKYFNVSDSDAPQGTLLAGRPQQAAMERQGSIYNEKDAKKKLNDDGVDYYR